MSPTQQKLLQYLPVVFAVFQIFFLLALRNDALHLRWLSRLAWIVRNPTRLGRLMDADSAQAIHQAMLDAAGELPGALRPTGAAAGR